MELLQQNRSIQLQKYLRAEIQTTPEVHKDRNMDLQEQKSTQAQKYRRKKIQMRKKKNRNTETPYKHVTKHNNTHTTYLVGSGGPLQARQIQKRLTGR